MWLQSSVAAHMQVPLETKTVITTSPKNGIKVTVHER